MRIASIDFLLAPIKTAENVKASKSKELVHQPKPLTKNKTQQDLNSPTGSKNSSPMANMEMQKQSTSKLPWQDNDFSDDSESEVNFLAFPLAFTSDYVMLVAKYTCIQVYIHNILLHI